MKKFILNKSADNKKACKMSRVVRKPAFCMCENKDTDQLRGNREADQHLCFRYIDRPIPLLSESKISSLLPASVVTQPGLCRTWSETPKTGFLTTRLKLPSMQRVQTDFRLTLVMELNHQGIIYRGQGVSSLPPGLRTAQTWTELKNCSSLLEYSLLNLYKTIV